MTSPSKSPALKLPALRVLVIDDEKNILVTLSMCLESRGCTVVTAASASAALQAIARQPFDLAFLDLRIRDTSGLELLPKLLHESPELAVVVITAYASFDTAAQAIKGGAMDYLPSRSRPRRSGTRSSRPPSGSFCGAASSSSSRSWPTRSPRAACRPARRACRPRWMSSRAPRARRQRS